MTDIVILVFFLIGDIANSPPILITRNMYKLSYNINILDNYKIIWINLASSIVLQVCKAFYVVGGREHNYNFLWNLEIPLLNHP